MIKKIITKTRSKAMGQEEKALKDCINYIVKLFSKLYRLLKK